MRALFRPGECIQDEQNERRWEIVSGPISHPAESHFLHRWMVRDQKLMRTVNMLCLNYASIPNERLLWDVPLLRAAFLQLIEALSPNHLCLPEPVDLVKCRHPHLPDSLASGEPMLLYTEPSGHPLRPFQMLARPKRLQLLRRLCLYTAYALRDLHRYGCLLRALPLDCMRRNSSNGAMLISAFSSLCRSHEFTGFHRYEAGLHPALQYAAPECFVERGTLGPPADVYALGRLLIEALGEVLPPRLYTEDELESMAAKHKLPPFWTRFLKLTQHDNPSDRFDGMQDVIVYVNSEGKNRTSLSRQSRTSQPIPRTQRPDAPSAALLIWNPGLVNHHQRFSFKSFLRRCQSLYSIETILFFAHEQKNMDNAFFRFLRSLSFDIVPLARHASHKDVLRDTRARWDACQHLVVVGHTRQFGVQSLLEMAQERDQKVSLYLTGGPQPQGISCLDPSAFLDSPSRTQSSRRQPSRRKQENQS